MESTDNNELQDKLDLINSMISKAKRSFSKQSFYYLLWGGLLFAAGIVEYLLVFQLDYEYSWIVWPAMGVIGGIASSIYGARQRQDQGFMSYTDRLFSYLWGGFMIALLIFIIVLVDHNVNPGPFIIVLTGVPTFVSGGIMNFRPLMFGGILFWIIGAISFYSTTEYQSLLFSLAILVGYIIPGYILKNAEKREEV